MSSKYRNYSQEDLVNALEAVKHGMPCATASKTFNVPRPTIIAKIQGKYPVACKSGVSTTLTAEEESILANWIISVGKTGFPVTKEQLLDSVALLIKKLQRPNNFTLGRPGRHWYEGFLRRHPQISLRITQNLTSSRAAVTEMKIKRWFGEMDTVDIGFLKDHLAFMESRIENKKLQDFRVAAENKIWQGDQKDTNLFQFWYNIYLETKIDENIDELEDPREDLIAEKQIAAVENEREIQIEIDDGLVLEGNWIKDLLMDKNLESNNQSELNKEENSLILENKIQPAVEPRKVVNIQQDITIVQVHREEIDIEKGDRGKKVDNQEKLPEVEDLDKIETELDNQEKLPEVEDLDKIETELESREAIEIQSDLENLIENEKENMPMNIETNANISSPSKSENMPMNMETNANIPSPFKSVLFWPNNSPSINKKKNMKREIVPSVCSSEKWKQFIEKREQEKLKKEEGIKERKRMREENKAKKENIKKLKSNKVKVANASKRKLFEEEETKKESKLKFNINDHVIVQYEGEKYPGVVKDLKVDSAYISVMAISGISKWKWPSPPDQLWYEFEDIMEIITEPKAVNNRNVFCVPEIEKYHSFMM